MLLNSWKLTATPCITFEVKLTFIYTKHTGNFTRVSHLRFYLILFKLFLCDLYVFYFMEKFLIWIKIISFFRSNDRLLVYLVLICIPDSYFKCQHVVYECLVCARLYNYNRPTLNLLSYLGEEIILIHSKRKLPSLGIAITNFLKGNV